MDFFEYRGCDIRNGKEKLTKISKFISKSVEVLFSDQRSVYKSMLENRRMFTLVRENVTMDREYTAIFVNSTQSLPLEERSTVRRPKPEYDRN